MKFCSKTFCFCVIALLFSYADCFILILCYLEINSIEFSVVKFFGPHQDPIENISL